MFYNTEVKERNSTICRNACFSVLRLISAAWYNTGHQRIQTCRVTWGQSAQTTTREVSFALLLMDTQLTPQSAQQHRSERNSTICRHACFSVLRLISAAWNTSRHAMTFALIYMTLALPSACGTTRAINVSRHAQSNMGQSAQTTTIEVSFEDIIQQLKT